MFFKQKIYFSFKMKVKIVNCMLEVIFYNKNIEI